MERIRNGWRLAKSSWRVLSQDRELVAIPIIAGLMLLPQLLAKRAVR